MEETCHLSNGKKNKKKNRTFEKKKILTSDRFSTIGNIKVVSPWLIWDVLYRAAAIFIISAGHLCFRWSLHSQAQASCTSPTKQTLREESSTRPKNKQKKKTKFSNSRNYFNTNRVSTVNLLGLLVIPDCSPGPCTRTRAGSQPSVTGTRNGLLGTGAES